MIAALAIACLATACAGETASAGGERTIPTAVVAPTATPEPEPVVMELGVAPGRRPGQVPLDALAHVESITGRRLDVVRTYAFWDEEFPDLRELTASADGRAIHLSINARREDDSVVPWADIASAPEGSALHGELVTWVERIAAFDGDLRVTFHHEADIEPEFGTPGDFVAAWIRMHDLLADAAPDVPMIWVMTLFTIADVEVAETFWPGDEFVDEVGADAFNWFGCRNTNDEAWRGPGELIRPLLAFGDRHPGIPLMFAELGSDEDPDAPERKAAWLDDLAVELSAPQAERIGTVIFFHNDHEEAGSDCDWWLDSTDEARRAFTGLAGLELFGGDRADTVDPPCPIVATMFSQPDDLAVVDGDGDGRYDFEFGAENRFLGIGDQSNDGSDHRVHLRFDPVGELPSDAVVQLRIRVGGRTPALPAPVSLLRVQPTGDRRELFGQPGDLIEPALFDATTVDGHHEVDVTAWVDPTQPLWVRLQLATRPPRDDGKHPLFIGTGDAVRSIDRPALIVRDCG